MAYDRARGWTVLFGGADPGVDEYGDTWEYDGTMWTQMKPAQSPSPRNGMGMDYDTARGKVIGFGGDASDSPHYSETWVYDGTTWTQIALSGLPLARLDYGMA